MSFLRISLVLACFFGNPSFSVSHTRLCVVETPSIWHTDFEALLGKTHRTEF
jgi:hypothetical protein